MRLTFAGLISILLLLHGCAAPVKRIPIADAMPARDGVVYASLAMSKDMPLSYEDMRIRPLGQGASSLDADIRTSHDWRAYFAYELQDFKQAHFSDPNEMGYVYAAALPPGEYEIYSFRWRQGSYTGSTKEYISIPFRVNAGQATYLGRFVGEVMRAQLVAQGSVMTDSTLPLGFRYRIRSEMDHDTALLRTHFPSVQAFKPMGIKMRTCPYAVCQ